MSLLTGDGGLGGKEFFQLCAITDRAGNGSYKGNQQSMDDK